MRLFVAFLWLAIFFADVCRAGMTWAENVEQGSSDSEFWATSETSVSENLDTDVALMTTSPTRTHEATKRLQYIKDLLLKKLGMKQPPALNVPMSIPSNLQDVLLSETQNDHPAEKLDEPGHFFAETKKVISIARTRPNTSDCCFFKFTPEVRQNKIASAYLWVYVQPSKTIQDTAALLRIYGWRQQTENSAMPKYLLNETKIDTRRRSGWIYFNIKNTVQHWLGEPSTNRGIEIVSPNTMDLVVTGPIETGNNQLPYLEIQTSQRGHIRSKRSAVQDCPKNGEVEQCCRHPLEVNFKNDGMEYVAAPKTYDAYYCTGECNIRSNAYSLLLSLRGIEQCCNPLQREAITIIYYTDSYTLKKARINDMVVNKCECS
ncbi:growth/differentiation factor 8-like [Saccoglossus kowalevskii]|uniref:Growth/differentiation factor 8-like n=1 Tax=Saccoglossus kowalevskii TaxID=10224 RepID=A0ABM0MXJ4_SACKO|nr:PREDICTED: growth/differentiation factor 8-like [Saccoglossus kowalevskii]